MIAPYIMEQDEEGEWEMAPSDDPDVMDQILELLNKGDDATENPASAANGLTEDADHLGGGGDAGGISFNG